MFLIIKQYVTTVGKSFMYSVGFYSYHRLRLNTLDLAIYYYTGEEVLDNA